MMLPKNNRLLWTAASMSIVVFASCGTNADPDPSTGTAPETSRVEIPEEMSGVAELPEAEQGAALEQKICPVSDEPIGSMGKPIKVPVEGQDVYVCCEGCVDMVKENPTKYLAKLKQE